VDVLELPGDLVLRYDRDLGHIAQAPGHGIGQPRHDFLDVQFPEGLDIGHADHADMVDFLEKGAQRGVGLRGRAEFDLFKGPPAAPAPG